jgi:HIRAN domain-containing protein
MTPVQTVVVGTKFRGAVAIEAAGRLRKGDALRLEREPENPFDPNAIAVYYAGLKIGFIPKLVNPRLAPLMDRGEQLEGVVEAAAVIRDGKVRTEPKITVRPRVEP